MSVADRWHTRKPRPGVDQPCRQHNMWPSAEHGQGDRWQVRWVDDNGTQHSANRPKKAGKDPDTCAEAYDAQIHAELNAGTYVDPAAGQITLAAYIDTWRAGLTLGDSSLDVIDKRLAHIRDVPAGPRSRRAPGASPIGPVGMRKLSKRPSAIQAWIKGLEAKGLSANYIGQIVSTLSTVFNAAIDDGVVAANPTRARSVKPPRLDRGKKTPWTAAMVEAAAAELESRYGCGAMAYLGAGAGLRESEIFALGEEDVEFLGRDRTVHVRRQVKRSRGGALYFALPKGRKTRDVPLAGELALRLAAHLDAHPPAEVTLPWGTPDGPTRTVRLLFPAQGDTAWYPQKFQHRWQTARTAAGAPVDPQENGLHVLRHTFASACLSGGVDIRTLAEWLGHDDPGFTLRVYTHLMPSASDRGRKAVDAFLARPGEDGGGVQASG